MLSHDHQNGSQVADDDDEEREELKGWMMVNLALHHWWRWWQAQWRWQNDDIEKNIIW